MKRFAPLLFVLALTACGIEGPEGPVGPPGAQGPRGEPGASLTTSYTCNAVATVANQYVAFNGVRYEFEDGSVLTTCIVNDKVTSYSTTFLYRDDQPGAESGSCLVLFDIDAPSEGYWGFSMLGTGTGFVQYVDPTSSRAGQRVNLACTRR